LNWTQADLAEAATLGIATIKNFENERRETTAANLNAIQRALEDAGVDLIAPKGGKGVGVRVRKS
jgi:transcriptional regulator with XRE-family HTH domain